jgi:hypothetical protein
LKKIGYGNGTAAFLVINFECKKTIGTAIVIKDRCYHKALLTSTGLLTAASLLAEV